MCYYGEGGFTFSDVYSMPVQMRRFYFNELAEAKKKEQDEMKKAQSKNKVRKPKLKIVIIFHFCIFIYELVYSIR